jgi:hypothetical protein
MVASASSPLVGGQDFNAIVFQVFQGLLDERAQVSFVVNNQNLHRVH